MCSNESEEANSLSVQAAYNVSQDFNHILEHTCVQMHSLNTDPGFDHASIVNLTGPQRL